MASQYFVVLTNPVEGKEDEYNDWYDNIHLPDVLKVPGVRSAQRFRLGDVQRSPAPHPWLYLAIYEVEDDMVQTVVDEIAKRAGTPVMPLSDALDGDRLSWFFRPLGEPRVSSA